MTVWAVLVPEALAYATIATRLGWVVVSMANDWDRVFPDRWGHDSHT